MERLRRVRESNSVPIFNSKILIFKRRVDRYLIFFRPNIPLNRNSGICFPVSFSVALFWEVQQPVDNRQRLSQSIRPVRLAPGITGESNRNKPELTQLQIHAA